ncbi:hypothetical protein IAU60_003667 [Kwoniella sp. DSM 27419]
MAESQPPSPSGLSQAKLGGSTTSAPGSSSRPPVDSSAFAQAQATAHRFINAKTSPEKSYVGPSRGALPPPRSKAQAERYFAQMGGDNILPTRAHKLLGVGGWILGGFSCVYMALYADFGEKEHVFSPVRRQYASLRDRFFTLSPTEREIMGLNDKPKGLNAQPDFRRPS